MHDIDYREVFVTIPLGVVFHDAQGRICQANPAAEAILGLTFEQMQGCTLFDPRWRATREDGSSFPAEMHPALVALHDGVPVRNVVMGVINPHTEREIWMRMDAVPLFQSGAQEPLRAYTMLEEITVQKRSKEALSRGIESRAGNATEDPVTRSDEQHWPRTSRQPVDSLPGLSRTVLVNDVNVTDRQVAAKAEDAPHNLTENLAEALRDTVAVLTTQYDMDAALRRILALAEQVVAYDMASIYLVEGNRASLTCRLGRGIEAGNASFDPAVLMELPRFQHSIQSGVAYLVEDTSLAPDWVPVAGTEWIRSGIGVPIVVRDKVFGVLALDHAEPDRFTARDVAALDAFARYAGLAIENAAQIVTLEQKVAQRTTELSNAKNRIEAILDSCPIGILLIDGDLKVLTSNRWGRALLGSDATSAGAAMLGDYLAPGDGVRVAQAAATVLETQVQQVLEVSALRSDGTAFDAELSIGYVRDIDRGHAGLVCTVNDITARLQATAALRASDERWQFALEGNGDGVWDWNLATDVVFYSPRWKAMLGYCDDEIGNTAEAWASRVHPEDLPAALTAIQTHLAGELPFYVNEHRMLARDGSDRWILDRGKVVARDADGLPLRFIGTHSDITERKDTETQLARHVDLQQILMDTALHFINLPLAQLDQGITDVLGSVSQFNQADRAYIFDYDHANGAMHNTYEWCAPGIAPEIDNLQNVPMALFPAWVDAHTHGRTVYIPNVAELTVEDPLRAVLEAQAIKSLVTIPLTDDDRCLGFIGFDAVRALRTWSELDIVLLRLLSELIVNAKRRSRNEEALKQAVERLRVSEDRLRNAHRIGRLGDWQYDAATGRVDWSAEVFLAFGRDPAHGVPDLATIMTLFHTADRLLLEQAIQEALGDGTSYELELRVLRPDSVVNYILVRGEPEVDATGKIMRVRGTLLDITARKQSQLALQRALERERELNELKSRFVAMASHEFRNPLATILASAETLLGYGERLDREQTTRRLRRICDQVNHLQAIISDVLQLSRIEAGIQEVKATVVDFGAFCAGLIDNYMERPELVQRIHYRQPERVVTVSLDPRLMRQAIDNIIENAIKYSSPDADIAIELTAEERGATLAVRDQGIGIPESSLSHIFERFHRGPNVTMISGTGLGLPITKELVTLQGGTIAVESAVGAGTTVQICLPLFQAG